MEIIWRDIDLKDHIVNLKNAVDVKINGIAISLDKSNGLVLSANNRILIIPTASNTVIIKQAEK